MEKNSKSVSALRFVARRFTAAIIIDFFQYFFPERDVTAVAAATDNAVMAAARR